MADQPIKYNSQLEKDQSDDSSAPVTKRIILYLWDSINLAKVRAKGNSDGSLAIGGLNLPIWDYVIYTATNSTTDTWIYKTGGSSGVIVATVTIVYTDSTKAQISTVTKT